MKEKVGICPNCGFPLISTMAFSYAEKYCMNCGGNFGMMDVSYEFITSKIQPFLTKANRKFGQIRRFLIGGGMHYRNCEKCEDEPHLNHASDKEIEKFKWAINKLESLKTSFEWEN